MPEGVRAALVRQLLEVMREALEGGRGHGTYFVDDRPGSGLLGALAEVGPAEASRPVGGSTIAAHAHHVAFGLEAAADHVEGLGTSPDWAESWRVTTVDELGWSVLQDRMRRAHARLHGAIESRGLSTEASFGEALAGIAHLAYHLGAIRQKLAVLHAEGAKGRR